MPLAPCRDADNASARIAGDLFEEIAKIGEASVRGILAAISKKHPDRTGARRSDLPRQRPGQRFR